MSEVTLYERSVCASWSHSCTKVLHRTPGNRLLEEEEVGRPVQGHLAYNKTPPLPRTAEGPQAEVCCRVLGGDVFL